MQQLPCLCRLGTYTAGTATLSGSIFCLFGNFCWTERTSPAQLSPSFCIYPMVQSFNRWRWLLWSIWKGKGKFIFLYRCTNYSACLTDACWDPSPTGQRKLLKVSLVTRKSGLRCHVTDQDSSVSMGSLAPHHLNHRQLHSAIYNRLCKAWGWDWGMVGAL